VRIGFDPHLDNINAAFLRRFASAEGFEFTVLSRPGWARAGVLLPAKMLGFAVRFFFSAVFHYDLVHVNSAKVGLIAWAASFFGARYIFTIHGCPHPELEREEGRFKAFLSRVEVVCMKIVVRRARAVTTISCFSRDELRERYGIESLVFYNGVEPMKSDMTKRKARAAFGLAACDPVYISVGRMIAYKDPLRILDIFLRAERKNPGARLIYIGDGILRGAFLRRCEEPDLAGRVLHLPRVSFDDMSRAYTAADYFLSGCDTEGFGLAAIESLMCGCRPLLPRSGAFPEIFRDTSFFYARNFSFKKGPRSAKETRRILGEFSWDNALVRWENLYRKESR
jgi:glycosyltransferase involved in cell wall biosynthesis